MPQIEPTPNEPSAGRIVHYVLPENRARAGEIRAAVITRVFAPIGAPVHPGMSNLRLMLDGPNDLGEADWVGSVVYSAKPKPGTWHWPPIVTGPRGR